jgi:phosphoribosylformylglycinamidine synthase subunit PurS
LRVEVFITPRKGILDPQGRAVEGSLRSLGFDGVAGVRVGRYITLEIEASSTAEAAAAVKKMCDQLLANPNIEEYRFEVGGVIEPSLEALAIPLLKSGDRE